MFDSSVFGDNDGGGYMGSQSPGAQKTSAKRIQSVVPMVTHQIHDLPGEDGFELNGFTIQLAHIVGILKDFNVQSTKATCTVHDHTGSIECILWIEEGDSVDLPQVKDNCYVQVYGTIRSDNRDSSKKKIMILKLSPVDDCNIITNHLLKAIHVSCLTRAHAGNKVQIGTDGGKIDGMESGDNLGSDLTSSMTPLEARLYQTVKNESANKGDEGVARSKILAKFAPGQHAELNRILENFLTEGHIYTTISMDNFKTTD